MLLKIEEEAVQNYNGAIDKIEMEIKRHEYFCSCEGITPEQRQREEEQHIINLDCREYQKAERERELKKVRNRIKNYFNKL